MTKELLIQSITKENGLSPENLQQLDENIAEFKEDPGFLVILYKKIPCPIALSKLTSLQKALFPDYIVAQYKNSHIVAAFIENTKISEDHLALINLDSLKHSMEGEMIKDLSGEFPEKPFDLELVKNNGEYVLDPFSWRQIISKFRKLVD